MKFYCSDCGKLYQKCKCTVYMSAYRFGRTDPLPKIEPQINQWKNMTPTEKDDYIGIIPL